MYLAGNPSLCLGGYILGEVMPLQGLKGLTNLSTPFI